MFSTEVERVGISFCAHVEGEWERDDPANGEKIQRAQSGLWVPSVWFLVSGVSESMEKAG